MFDGVDLSVEHVLMFVISAFLLYHLMDRCSCMRSGNGFSVGYQADIGYKCNNKLKKLCRKSRGIPNNCNMCVGENQQALMAAHCTNSNVNEWCKTEDKMCTLYYQFQDKNDLKTAVEEWLKNQKNAEDKYGPIYCWDTSNVTDMSGMFSGAKSFNGDISSWDTSSVNDMSDMFWNAKSFNGDISQWDTSLVKYMGGMFTDATLFDSNLSGWDTKKVTNMVDMFGGTDAFNCDTNIIKDTPLYNQCIIDKR